MKANKLILSSILAAGLTLSASQASAMDLLQTYQLALQNDQTYANAVSTAKVTAEKSPQALAVLLPQINGTGSGAWAKSRASGSGARAGGTAGTSKTRTFRYGLDLTQQIFNYTDWLALGSAKSAVKAAYANLSYAKQTLMTNTSKAYFLVLADKQVLKYDDALKRALLEQYKQAQESFNVGTKTITDVDQAKAAYDSAVATYIGDQNTLNTHVEALSVITGKIDTDLTPLAKTVELISPNPQNVNDWINSTVQHNWQIISDKYTVLADKDSVKSQWGGHLPTVDGEVEYAGSKVKTTSPANKTSQIHSRGPTATLNLSIPIFSGFNVTSQVRQAIAQQEADQATQELDQRIQLQNVRTNYAAIGYDISLIHANYNAVFSDRSSLNSTIEGYKVGTQTMTDVLTAEQKLYSNLSTYAKSRYQYLNDAIALKQAAGTLSMNDIESINTWLAYPPTTASRSNKPVRANNSVKSKKTGATQVPNSSVLSLTS